MSVQPVHNPQSGGEEETLPAEHHLSSLAPHLSAPCHPHARRSPAPTPTFSAGGELKMGPQSAGDQPPACSDEGTTHFMGSVFLKENCSAYRKGLYSFFRTCMQSTSSRQGIKILKTRFPCAGLCGLCIGNKSVAGVYLGSKHIFILF